jgi:hypothetical protein
LELIGEKPIMPAPPKVWPPGELLVELEDEPELPKALEFAPLVPLIPDPLMPDPLLPDPLPVDDESVAPVELVALDPNNEELPEVVDPPPLGPVPAITELPAEPDPASGSPKKPSVCVLACPNRIGFHSALPVVGSTYFLRRKRISWVFTSASRLGG